MAQTTVKQDEIDKATSALTALKLEKIESGSEIKLLKEEKNATIALKLARQKAQPDAEKNNSETELKLQIQQLKDDLKRASERAGQGSMQAQGEARELAIEETLTDRFPSDEVLEIKKGQRGAECLFIVKNSSGRFVGNILIESKNTKSFSET